MRLSKYANEACETINEIIDVQLTNINVEKTKK